MGRLCPQKDPSFFAAVAREAQDFNIEWTWIGGGSEDYADLLRDAGVKVTGWMDRSEALRLLAAADVYVHSAAWEGAPLTILEAAALGVPVIARHTEAVASLGVRTVSRPVEMARAVASLEDPRAHAEAVRLGDQLTTTNSPQRQREALLQAYSLASERARRRVATKPDAGHGRIEAPLSCGRTA